MMHPPNVIASIQGLVVFCRVCGCSDMNACEGAFGEGCWWEEFDLCSSCVRAP